MNEPLIREVARWVAAGPWLVLLTIAVPMVWLGWRRRIYPSRWWLVPLGISLGLSLLTIALPAMLLATVLVDALFLLVVGIDGVWLGRIDVGGITARRRIMTTCSINVPVPCELVIGNRTAMTLRGRVADDLPEMFEADSRQHDLWLQSGRRVTLTRRLTPRRRGAFAIERVDVEFASAMRFWNRQVTIALVDRIDVYPDMKQLSDYAILARTDRLSQIGVRRTRRVGNDSDFERLRDYSRDDHYRHIDWRSTARRRKLTVRQYQFDQSQRIMFLLDCGRMMTGNHDGLSLLDHSLNSMLMMSYVALYKGDSVGLICFDDQVRSYLPPRGGPGQMNRLMRAGFDQFPRMVESRYDNAFMTLRQRCKKRSMVVLATNLIDEVNAAAVRQHLLSMRGRHLPMAWLMRDADLFDAADEYERLVGDDGELSVATMEDRTTMFRSAVAADILLWRDSLIRDLQHRGALVVDATPAEMTAELVNAYLEVKARKRL